MNKSRRLGGFFIMSPLPFRGEGQGEGWSCVAFGDAYLWVADPRQVTFFARAKKVTKESTPPDGANTPLRFSLASARAPTRQPPKRGLGSNTRRASTPMPAAVLGRAIRGWKEHPCQGLRWVANPPVSRTEHRSEVGSIREPFDRARGAFPSARRVRRAPGFARSAGDRAYCAR